MIGKIFRHLFFALLFMTVAVMLAILSEFFLDFNIHEGYVITDFISDLVNGIVEFIPFGDITVKTILFKLNPTTYMDYTPAMLINEFITPLILGVIMTIMQTLFGKEKNSNIISSLLSVLAGAAVLSFLKTFDGWIKITVSSTLLVVLGALMVYLIIKSFKEKSSVTFIISRVLLIIINAILAVVVYCYFLLFAYVMGCEFVRTPEVISDLLFVMLGVCGAYALVEGVKDAAESMDEKGKSWRWF